MRTHLLVHATKKIIIIKYHIIQLLFSVLAQIPNQIYCLFQSESVDAQQLALGGKVCLLPLQPDRTILDDTAGNHRLGSNNYPPLRLRDSPLLPILDESIIRILYATIGTSRSYHLHLLRIVILLILCA